MIGSLTPWGHSLAAHRVHGWCLNCPNRDILEELHAWRNHTNQNVDLAEEQATNQPGKPEDHRGR